jgi:transposase-like protein
MARNQIQFQKGLSLTQFLDEYGTEVQCHQALYQWKWPEGFQCPHCGHSKYSKVSTRKLYQCSRCHHQTSVTSGSIFAATKLPHPTWFLGIYLMTQSKNGISALELMRQLGITYNAAWLMKHS